MFLLHTGSLTELVTVLDKEVTVDEVNAAMKEASNESLRLQAQTKFVSSDIVGMTYGSLFDATQTKVMTVGDKQLVKTVAWYDNEMSYTATISTYFVNTSLNYKICVVHSFKPYRKKRGSSALLRFFNNCIRSESVHG